MYQILAKYYDGFMKGIDYLSWADYVCGFIDNKGAGVDLACGSGLFTLELYKKGIDIYGVDISEQMLSRAYQNARLDGLETKFILGDINDFRFIRPHDFATIICDGVNYLKNPLTAFENIYRQLKNNGVLVFDISTEYKLKNILSGSTFSDSTTDVTYIWHSFLSKKQDCVKFDLTFFERKGELYRKSVETQVQYIHSKDKIIDLLKKAGFNSPVAYSHLKVTPPKLNDERITFVARKGA